MLILPVLTVANAESWVSQDIGKPGDRFFQYDQDSVHQGTDGAISVTWQEGPRGSGATPVVEEGIIDCIGLSITLTVFSITDALTISQKGYKAAVEAGRRDVVQLDPVMQISFPNLEEPKGRMIHKICGDLHLSRDNLMVELAAKVRDLLQCSATTGAPSLLCSKGNEVTQALGMVMFRQTQVWKSCGLPQEAVGQILLPTLLDQAPGRRRCNTDLTCRVADLNQFATDMGYDLAASRSGKPCERMAFKKKMAEEQDRRLAASKRFWACVKNESASLDDRMSSADIVASGVIASCREAFLIPEFNSMQDDQAEIDKLVRPGVIAQVLAHRAKNRSGGGANNSAAPSPAM
jgi:hypothetical protein